MRKEKGLPGLGRILEIQSQTEPSICSICQGEYTGFGNNAWPINDGRCCNDCNALVITARLRQMLRMKPKRKETT